MFEDKEGFLHFKIETIVSLPNMPPFNAPSEMLDLTLDAASWHLRKVANLFELTCMARMTDIQPNGVERPSAEMTIVRNEIGVLLDWMDHVMEHCENRISEFEKDKAKGEKDGNKSK